MLLSYTKAQHALKLINQTVQFPIGLQMKLSCNQKNSNNICKIVLVASCPIMAHFDSHARFHQRLYTGAVRSDISTLQYNCNEYDHFVLLFRHA